MKKLSLLISVILLTLPFVSAVIPAQCPSPLVPDQSCLLLTPSINCTSPAYNIINLSSKDYYLINQPLINTSVSRIYALNLTLPKGDYQVMLCDGTTRELNVGGESGSMIFAIIPLLPLILGALFMYAAMQMSDEHAALKVFAKLFAFIAFFYSFHLATVVIINFFSFPELVETMANMTYAVGWIFGIVVFYHFFWLIKILFDVMAQKRRRGYDYSERGGGQ